MNSSQARTILIILAFSAATFAGGYLFGRSGFEARLSRDPGGIEIVNRARSGGDAVDFSLFWQVWDLLGDKYLEKPLDGRALLYGAIDGLVSSLGDPYTTFLPPEDNEAFSDGLKGEYEGIGAELGIRDDQLVIVAPLEGSPAEAAGVKAGDRIVEVNGENTSDWSVSEAVARIRGQAGTKVNLSLQRRSFVNSEEALNTLGSYDSGVLGIEVTRGRITIPSLSWRREDSGEIYIRLSRFGEDTNSEWRQAVEEIQSSPMGSGDSFVLDVRGNPGGYLDAAVYVASEFIRGGVIVQEDFGGGEASHSLLDRSNSAFSDRQVVVLIDGGSASASEILAAALRERRQAVLVGEPSFGKGTVQDAADFNDGSGIHVTVAKWLTPNGDWIHEKGLAPDVLVENTAEDFESGKDPQLERALQVLSAM